MYSKKDGSTGNILAEWELFWTQIIRKIIAGPGGVSNNNVRDYNSCLVYTTQRFTFFFFNTEISFLMEKI